LSGFLSPVLDVSVMVLSFRLDALFFSARQDKGRDSRLAGNVGFETAQGQDSELALSESGRGFGFGVLA